jgi:hypothetical protein
VTDKPPARPSQVTLAGWLVVAGSVVVVVMAFSRVATLHSLDTRQSIENYLASPTGQSLGLTVTTVQTLLRIAAMAAAATATATAILGWQVLQRSRGARVALTALAAPLFVTGFVGSGFAAAVVTAAIVMLWFQPARDWFDGITRPAPTPPTPPTPPAPLRPLAAPPGTPVGRDPLLDLPPPTAPPLHATPYAGRPSETRAHADRPNAVVWACAITWASTAVVFLLFAVTLVQVLVAPNSLLDEMRRQNPDLTMSDADLTRVLVVVSVVFLVWSAAAAALTMLVWRRVAWASIVLSVSAVLACLTLVPIIASVATVVLLQRSESRAWLRAGQHMRTVSR